MEEVKVEVKIEDQPEVKPKPKLHIWNQILEDDELSERLAASMNKLGDEFARRFIRKRKNKNKKKKKKSKKECNQPSVDSNGHGCTNGMTNQAKESKPESKIQLTGQPQSKPQQSNKPNHRWNNRRQGSSKRKERLSNRVLTSEAENISKKLKEKRIDLIIRTIRFLGLDEAMKLCSEVLTIEEAGGLMTMNGTRRRTPGGIFFHLIRSSGRYDSNIVSKLFKEGDNKEPVFKSRNKSRNTPTVTTTVPSVTVVNVNNVANSSDLNGIKVEETDPIQITQPKMESDVQQQQQPDSSIIQSTNSMDLKPSDAVTTVDVKMEDEDDDDIDNPSLVIVESDPGSPDSCQPISPTSILVESHPTINSNVTIFTSNRISVDA